VREEKLQQDDGCTNEEPLSGIACQMSRLLSKAKGWSHGEELELRMSIPGGVLGDGSGAQYSKQQAVCVMVKRGNWISAGFAILSFCTGLDYVSGLIVYLD